MTAAFVLSVAGAAGIAMLSALFGVGMARMIWADDLRHARQIDEIRSKTEGHLRSQIRSLEQQLTLLKK